MALRNIKKKDIEATLRDPETAVNSGEPHHNRYEKRIGKKLLSVRWKLQKGDALVITVMWV